MTGSLQGLASVLLSASAGVDEGAGVGVGASSDAASAGSPAPQTMSEAFAALTVGDALTAFMLLAGVILCGLSAIGILRMPDLYTRMQASAKAGTLGVACIILATAAHFASLGVGVKVVMILVFIFLTTPAAAHLIARAAYFVDVPIWKRTAYDDLHGCYTEDHRLIDVPAKRTTTPIGEGQSDEARLEEAASESPPRATG